VTGSVALLDLTFADLDASAAARWIAERPVGAPFGYVVTPNADHLMRLARDPALLAVYRAAALRLLDSRVVARTARALGLPTPLVAPGSDLTARLLLRHVRPDERIVIIGLRREWLPGLMARCGLSRRPWHFDPPIGFDDDPAAFDAAVRFVLAHQARFVFLAVGSPRQERLAAAIGRATGTGLCIGASLEFLAGTTRRAPPWMQQAGLEWLFRLLGDPRRLASRYLVDDPGILLRLLRERLRAGTCMPDDAADSRRAVASAERRAGPVDRPDQAHGPIRAGE
jgi:exopolysaccharide biosynthesis WecB/TagA/CpsF family protein